MRRLLFRALVLAADAVDFVRWWRALSANEVDLFKERENYER